MDTQSQGEASPFPKGHGQVLLRLDTSLDAPAEQVRNLYKLSDPALSELEFDALLDELLVRVRDLLGVDTAAILLHDPATHQLVASAAKGIEEEVEQGVRIPVGRGFAGRIAEERVAIFIEDVDHADILNPILREKGIRSMLGVPLIVEGELIGVLHIGSLRTRIFDQRDLAVLQLAAARAAPAIERARLLGELHREHQTTMMLQRSLLPRTLGEMGGITVAARYLPARDDVGGDWYDAIDLGGGQVGIAIGDVVGHGLAAATLMGQLRTALHAYAAEGHDPVKALELVDRFAGTLGPGAMATAAYAVFETETNKLRLASAAHLPPLVISPDGSTRALDNIPAPPLGTLGYHRFTELEATLEEGSIVLFYTDGLVERPRVPLRTSVLELMEVIADAGSAEEACLLAVDRMVPPRGPNDDVAVIALQTHAVPAKLHLELPADPNVLAHMRRSLKRWLQKHEVQRNVAAEITIAVNEACGNAVEHAYGPGRGSFQVTGEAADGAVAIEVRDHGHWRPPRGTDRGRGLTIIHAVMDEVDVRAEEEGTTVLMRRELTR